MSVRSFVMENGEKNTRQFGKWRSWAKKESKEEKEEEERSEEREKQGMIEVGLTVT